MGLAWWLMRDSKPAPIAISLETLPKKFLGYDRVDLEMEAKGNSEQAEQMRKIAVARIESYRWSTGGDGIEAQYGILAGAANTRLQIVNGPLVLMPPATDADLDRIKAVTPALPVEAPGSATTKCTAASPMGVKGKDAAELRKLALDSTKNTMVHCVRYDPARNLSVLAIVTGLDEPARTFAPKLAAEVDQVFNGLT